MPRVKRWTMSGVNDGIGEVKLISWKYFHDFIYQEMLDYESYIWRGQRCDNWLLESTFDRLVKKAKISKTEVRHFRTAHLEQFKYATRGRRGHNPPRIESENDWWALGQHHGLATPLLDWTTSPFAAAYFAFIGIGDKQTAHRAIYGLHKPSIEVKVAELYAKEQKKKIEAKKKAEAEQQGGTATLGTTQNVFRQIALKQGLLDIPVKEQIEFVRPLSDENQRLVNQGGLFTRGPEGTDFESWIKVNSGSDKGYTLIKVLIPNKDRAECLKTLNRMNINHSTLFPDLYGASIYCNLFGEIEGY